MKSASLTRRKLMILGASGLFALGAASIIPMRQRYMGSVPKLFERLFSKRFPGVQFDDESFDKFEEEIISIWPNVDGGFGTFLRRYSFLLSVGIDPSLVMPKEAIYRFERRLITHYLERSDYFRINTQIDKVTYVGKPAACPNPFARFS